MTAKEGTVAASVNKVILVGNLGRDPEVRFNPEGGKIVNLSLATGESWRDKTTGERRDRTEWHRVVIFNERLAEVAERYLKKGSKIFLEGQLQTRKWTDQEGKERYTTEIVVSRYRGELTMLDSRNASEESANAEGGHDFSSAGPAAPAQNFDHLNDEIPF